MIYLTVYLTAIPLLKILAREDLETLIGSVEFWLDMRSLIKGVALAKRRGLCVKFLIVGKGIHTNYSDKVVRWVKDMGLEKQTLWLDFIPQDEVPEYMATMDVGTIPFDLSNPTAYYAAPNKMWEYLSQMRPVVSAPIPEALNNSDCLLLASNPQDYASKILLISRRDSEVLEKLENGYSKSRGKSWEKSAELFASTLNAILNGMK